MLAFAEGGKRHVHFCTLFPPPGGREARETGWLSHILLLLFLFLTYGDIVNLTAAKRFLVHKVT
jgi:hypothetical protein